MGSDLLLQHWTEGECVQNTSSYTTNWAIVWHPVRCCISDTHTHTHRWIRCLICFYDSVCRASGGELEIEKQDRERERGSPSEGHVCKNGSRVLVSKDTQKEWGWLCLAVFWPLTPSQPQQNDQWASVHAESSFHSFLHLLFYVCFVNALMDYVNLISFQWHREHHRERQPSCFCSSVAVFTAHQS